MTRTGKCTILYSRGCLTPRCGYSTTTQRFERWAAVKMFWHRLLCRWARWPERRPLLPALGRFHVSDPKGLDEEET